MKLNLVFLCFIKTLCQTEISLHRHIMTFQSEKPRLPTLAAVGISF